MTYIPTTDVCATIVSGSLDVHSSAADPNTVINVVHARAHRGEAFTVGHYATSISATPYKLLLQTPASANVHTAFAFGAGGNSTFKVFEDTTFTTTGTSLSATNLNRVNGDSFPNHIYYGGTVDASGTLLYQGYIFGGGALLGNGTTQDSFIRDAEFILAPGTNYYFQVNNVAGGVHAVAANFTFYKVSV